MTSATSRQLPFALLALLLLAVVSSPAAAQQTAPLTGVVADASGAVIGSAVVEARGAVVRTAVTRGDGTFRFPALPTGPYRLSVEGLGFRGATEVTVGPRTPSVRLVVDAAPIAIEPLRVVATVRGDRPAASLPVKVDVLDTDAIDTQQSLASNPTELLSNLVPSFSPGRQKLTSSGESFRGRRPLFLIDGVPQSNPLRDGRRDGFTIGMDAIERVEVVFGANAIQGLGATGGIVNYLTVSPPSDGRLEQRLSLSSTVNDGFDGDGTGFRGSYRVARDFGSFDALASVTLETRGLQYDGEGRPIALDNVQGDIADSESRSFFAKFGWEPSESQRLQLSVSDFRLEQQGGFVSVEGDRDAGLPAVSIEGTPDGVQPVNDVTTASLDWEDRDLFGGTGALKLYAQDFSALFGGGVFGVFQDPDIAPVGSLFDQSENNSEKFGARATWNGRPVASLPVDVVTGLDAIADRTFQRLALTDRNWVPETTFRNVAPFLQADLDLLDGLSVSGGLRWELAELDVPDFRTIAGNRGDFESVEVTGGSPTFDEPLLNVGVVATPLAGLRIYGTAAQAFTMPDVGRVLRGVSEPNTAVEDFLDLQPIETDNLEVGAVHSTERTRLGVTWFRSEADFGSRLVPNEDGIFQVTRQPTRTSGVELTGRFDPTRDLSFQAGWSVLEAKFDGDDDGDFESDLGAGNVGPDRLNLAVDLNRGGAIRGRVQSFTFFDRTFEDGAGATTAEFDGYTTVDASVSAEFGFPTVTLAVSNLFDTQYITYFGQAATNRDDRYFAGRGRTISLRLDASF